MFDRELIRKLLIAGAIASAAFGSLFAVKKVREFFSKSNDNQVPVVRPKADKKKGPKTAVKIRFTDDEDE